MKWSIYRGFKSGLSEQEWNLLNESDQKIALYGKKLKAEPEREPTLTERVRGITSPTELHVRAVDRDAWEKFLATGESRWLAEGTQ